VPGLEVPGGTFIGGCGSTGMTGENHPAKGPVPLLFANSCIVGITPL
jgi:hypothetical protein